MKKMIIFLAIIISLFIGLTVVSNVENEVKVEKGTKYKKDNLHPETVALINDDNYQNLILPEDLEKKLATHETVTVYFYSSTCPHCKRTTPILMTLAEKMGIDIDQYNLLEFEQGWDQYEIEGTPTLVHFVNGKEVARIDGYREEATFKQWFEENVK